MLAGEEISTLTRGIRRLLKMEKNDLYLKSRYADQSETRAGDRGETKVTARLVSSLSQQSL